MQRRKFIQNISLASIAAGFVPSYGLANFLPETNPVFLIPIGEAQTQIRHGALNLPIAAKENGSMPFDWLLQINRNIFFKNGFQRSESIDLEIISILLKNEEGLEAVQIQLSPEQTCVMIEDQFLTFGRTAGFQKVTVADGHTQLLIGHLEESKNYDLSFETEEAVFVQLLEGAISCNDQVLDLNTGLALENSRALRFDALADSRVIVFRR